MPLLLHGPSIMPPVPYGADRCRALGSRFRGDRVVDDSLLYFLAGYGSGLCSAGRIRVSSTAEFVDRIRSAFSRMPFERPGRHVAADVGDDDRSGTLLYRPALEVTEESGGDQPKAHAADSDWQPSRHKMRMSRDRPSTGLVHFPRDLGEGGVQKLTRAVSE